MNSEPCKVYTKGVQACRALSQLYSPKPDLTLYHCCLHPCCLGVQCLCATHSRTCRFTFWRCFRTAVVSASWHILLLLCSWSAANPSFLGVVALRLFSTHPHLSLSWQLLTCCNSACSFSTVFHLNFPCFNSHLQTLNTLSHFLLPCLQPVLSVLLSTFLTLTCILLMFCARPELYAVSPALKTKLWMGGGTC